MDESLLAAERDFRREVRRSYYRREEDFPTLRSYNDYLEEVEDPIPGLPWAVGLYVMENSPR